MPGWGQRMSGRLSRRSGPSRQGYCSLNQQHLRAFCIQLGHFVTTPKLVNPLAHTHIMRLKIRTTLGEQVQFVINQQ